MLLKVYQWVATMIVVRWAVEEDSNLPSCTHYTKGNFPATNITDAILCRTACATVEGFPVGDFTEDEEHHIHCTCTSEPDQEEKVPEIRELCADAGGAAEKNVTVTPTPAPVVTDPPATTPPTAAPFTAAPTTTTAPPTTSSPPTASSSGGSPAAAVPHGLPVAVVAVAVSVATTLL